MIQAAIIDDMSKDAEQINDFLKAYAADNGIDISISVFKSGEAFLEAMKPGKFSLIFLDIIMEGMDGLETARRLRQADRGALLVFVTTEADYAVEGYEVEASAFLVKSESLSRERFFRLMRRLDGKLRGGDLVDLSDSPAHLLLPSDALCFAEVRNHSLTIHTSGPSYSLRMPMNDFMARLPGDGRFFECYKGILINLDWIDSLDKQTVTLKTGQTLPVSRRKAHALANAYALRSFAKLRN